MAFSYGLCWCLLSFFIYFLVLGVGDMLPEQGEDRSNGAREKPPVEHRTRRISVGTLLGERSSGVSSKWIIVGDQG